MRARRGQGVLVDSWSSRLLGPEVTAFAPSNPRVANNQVLRGCALYLAARRFETVALHSAASSGKVFLALCALTGRRKAVVLEFIPPTRGTSAAAKADRVLRFLLRRGVVAAQVLTAAEVPDYSARFGVPASLFHFVPWPLRADPAEIPPASTSRAGVLMTGRDSCDWETLLEAARGQNWDLRVVCSADDADRVRALAAGGTDVDVQVNIPMRAHWEAVNSALVYVLCLYDAHHSAGQVRVMNAFSCGTPLVATDVSGLSGYLDAGAAVVPVGDAEALRDSVNQLLGSESARRELVAAASAASAGRGWDDYAAQLRELVTGAGVLRRR